MIYTLTFNPSLDYIVNVDNFSLGTTNKANNELILPGGKGINVSIVLTHLGMENTVLGFIGGFVGQHIETLCKQNQLTTQFIPVNDGCSRINIKLKTECETEINGIGPRISDLELTQLFHQLDHLTKADYLIMSGSIPLGLPSTIYQQIMEYLSVKNVPIIVDTTNQLLRNCLSYHPFLIKPNHEELSQLFNVNLSTYDQIIPYAKQLQAEGAVNVLVSCGKLGAVLLDEFGNVYTCNAPKGKCVNSVGSGDAMVAGFMYGFITSHDYEYALKLGISCGSASAFSTHLATKQEIFDLFQRL